MELLESKTLVSLVEIKAEAPKATKKRKLEPGKPQKDKLRYVNKQIREKVKKEVKTEEVVEIEVVEQAEQAPPELLPCSRKTEIPQLKIVPFKISQSQTYCISVDAFSFKPHESISQYFLSHFHSDHYGGITKRWCRERTLESKIIYCSPITGRLLTIRFKVDPLFIFSLDLGVRYKVYDPNVLLEDGGYASEESTPGVYVTTIDANHCPGAVIFLYEGISLAGELKFSLHCGDFRVNEKMLRHPLLERFHLGGPDKLESVYLDTTYMSPKYNFPKQEQVCESIADLVYEWDRDDEFVKACFGASLQSRITDFLTLGSRVNSKKILILVGTYLIGKEKLAIAILKKLGQCPIYVSNVNSRGDKDEIIRSYDDEYLSTVLTKEALTSTHNIMIHLVPMSIAGNLEELHKYFNHNKYYEHFARCVGIRPTGWSFQGNEGEDEPPEEVASLDSTSESIASTVALLKRQPSYTYHDVVAQNNPKKPTRDRSTYRIFSVPYSEHLSFRELSFFVIFLNIGKVIPTVNTHSEQSVQRMSSIINQWEEVRNLLKKAESSRAASAVRELSLDRF